ncbi:hypothetical protein ACF1BQ_029190 [Bradyrhizobium sp. RDT10]
MISGDVSDFETMHEILGHESVTIPFLQGLSVLDGKTGQPFPIAAVRLTQGRRSERGNALTTWLDIDVPPGPGQVLRIGLSSPRNGTSFAVAIPRDLEAPTPVRIDIGFRRMERDWDIESLTARLPNRTVRTIQPDDLATPMGAAANRNIFRSRFGRLTFKSHYRPSGSRLRKGNVARWSGDRGRYFD